MNFVGLDIETTGLDYAKGHRLIQVGIAQDVSRDPSSADGRLVITRDVRPFGRVVFDEEAMTVNGFTPERIARAPRQFEVEKEIVEKFEAAGFGPGEVTAVGWNVGAFDLHFLYLEMPTLAKFFSHRVLDLTGIAILLAEIQGKSREEIKREIQGAVAARLAGRGIDAEWHDAGYDARAALEAFALLRSRGWMGVLL